LPVVSHSGDLVGIVSFDDLLAALTMQLSEMTVVLGRGREQVLSAV
jgi:CBS-domain-containing membrane protein